MRLTGVGARLFGLSDEQAWLVQHAGAWTLGRKHMAALRLRGAVSAGQRVDGPHRGLGRGRRALAGHSREAGMGPERACLGGGRRGRLVSEDSAVWPAVPRAPFSRSLPC